MCFCLSLQVAIKTTRKWNNSCSLQIVSCQRVKNRCLVVESSLTVGGLVLFSSLVVPDVWLQKWG